MNPTDLSSSSQPNPTQSTDLDHLSAEQLTLLTEWVDAGIRTHTSLTDQQKEKWTLLLLPSPSSTEDIDYTVRLEDHLALLDMHLETAHTLQGMLKTLPTPDIPTGMIARVMKRLRRRYRRQIELNQERTWGIEVGSIVVLIVLVACAWLVMKESNSHQNRFNTPLKDLSQSVP